MNSKHPSEARIEWTTKSLNFSLPIMQSLKQLANSTDLITKRYQKDTVKDSGLIYDALRAKFGVWDEEVTINCDYDPLFYNPDENAVEQSKSPSELLNTSYTHVHAYVRNTQKLLMTST